MFRVYDNVKDEWVDDNVYLAPNGDLVMIKPIIGLVKSPIVLDPNRYIYHRNIGLQDVDDNEVFEGDYLLARIDEDKEVVGLVTFAFELSAYIILVEETSEFYTLGSDVTEFISVIGNVFDGIGDKKYS